jgi:hypothetical protein
MCCSFKRKLVGKDEEKLYKGSYGYMSLLIFLVKSFPWKLSNYSFNKDESWFRHWSETCLIRKTELYLKYCQLTSKSFA